jgi:hypothetical protein
MRVKTIIDEDFINYKEASMFIGTISCNGKCCIEAGIPLSVCQNDEWRSYEIVDVSDEYIVNRYIENIYTSAIVFGGLEPFEQFKEVYNLIKLFRKSKVDDPIIIYTGYDKYEIIDQVDKLRRFDNIIIKFGRYIPDQESVYDDILGVTLASDNQYAEIIS